MNFFLTSLVKKHFNRKNQALKKRNFLIKELLNICKKINLVRINKK